MDQQGRPAIVIVDASTGAYRALDVGSATITASCEGKSDTLTITVTKNPDLKTPDNIILSGIPSEMSIGQTATASATVKDQYGNPPQRRNPPLDQQQCRHHLSLFKRHNHRGLLRQYNNYRHSLQL